MKEFPKVNNWYEFALLWFERNEIVEGDVKELFEKIEPIEKDMQTLKENECPKRIKQLEDKVLVMEVTKKASLSTLGVVGLITTNVITLIIALLALLK